VWRLESAASARFVSATVGSELTSEGGEVDLLIRTGGEKHPVRNEGSSSSATALLESTGAGVSDNRHPAPGEATFYQGERDGAPHNTPAFVRALRADSNAALPLTASMDSRAGLDALETPDAGEFS
jgi:hypothetical protein